MQRRGPPHRPRWLSRGPQRRASIAATTQARACAPYTAIDRSSSNARTYSATSLGWLIRTRAVTSWIDPHHAETVARFRAARASVPPTACVPCRGTGFGSDGVALCRPCAGGGRQRPVRMFVTS